MNNYILFSTLTYVGMILIISIILIRKKYYVNTLKLFIALFVIGQIIGYGLGVDILKVVLPSFSYPESGVVYQVITSTILPLLLAFIIKDIYSFKEELNYKFFIRMSLLVLIVIGILAFFALAKILNYLLLVLAITLGGIGLFKKFQKG